MRQIALLALLLAFAAAVYGQENILEKGLEGRSAADVISRRYVTPLRLVALPGELTAGVENPEALLWNFDGQLTTGTPDVCRLSTRDGRSASVLLDFGKELCGGIALSAAIRADQRALKVRIRLGESVSEAMSDVGGDAPMASATNVKNASFVVRSAWKRKPRSRMKSARNSLSHGHPMKLWNVVPA